MYGGRYALREEQVKFYEENGYIQLHNVLTAEEVVVAPERTGHRSGGPEEAAGELGAAHR